jgi:hypothetical protein
MFPDRLEAFVVGAFCVWRVAHLLHAEDGPFDLAANLRQRAGEGFLGKSMGCFYCLSLWIALPVSLLISAGFVQFVLLWPALSGAACLAEQATRRDNLADFIREETKE